ncbi:hypothetical protein CAOG_03901 [Capsaspora owczarzaki ATCC 30864]|uniref:Large ribosomal subunit protein mL52 n=1 Tax=Capsaspora owczarzaki (strain ATCC 30864) TaxID=595528 RepID=A0A0D2WQ96_CAPO3|nr:hypothetical protein CAOG_03901 [Capsaspora owczarzaki ATCC 30864]KJE93053.1 hypothetical protein CAOG_003901 [Capsaspora owczarzaki ATCC 30864]|eukprot:XP_004363629.1 hypothetical protein CAOG_03901 [Capsaspora owczarzaki ATCC 30864]
MRFAAVRLACSASASACAPASAAAARHIHLSAASSAGRNVRLSLGMSRSGNEFGVLTDGPDWTSTDGKVANPVSEAQAKRIKYHSDIYRAILAMTRKMSMLKLLPDKQLPAPFEIERAQQALAQPFAVLKNVPGSRPTTLLRSVEDSYRSRRPKPAPAGEQAPARPARKARVTLAAAPGTAPNARQ